jgi:hypothetical protein
MSLINRDDTAVLLYIIAIVSGFLFNGGVKFRDKLTLKQTLFTVSMLVSTIIRRKYT